MARNYLSLVTIFGLLVASFCVSAEFGGRKSLAPAAAAPCDAAAAPSRAASAPTADLGFTLLDKKGSKAVELGRFAVDEYNKENKDSLVFEYVLEAILYTTPTEQGSKYGVVVAASSADNKALDGYTANILVTKDNVSKLISFAKLK